jgi:hypothetical protein
LAFGAAGSAGFVAGVPAAPCAVGSAGFAASAAGFAGSGSLRLVVIQYSVFWPLFLGLTATRFVGVSISSDVSWLSSHCAIVGAAATGCSSSAGRVQVW